MKLYSAKDVLFFIQKKKKIKVQLKSYAYLGMIDACNNTWNCKIAFD